MKAPFETTMEVLFKILVLLCFSSASFGARFVPAINIQSPISLGVGSNNVNSQQIKSRTELDECYCFPSNSQLGSVINILDASNESIERVVVYLYKIRGKVILFIPNENKQKPFPDLYFDDSEGDILAPVSSQLIVDIFDSNVFNQGQIVTISEEIVLEPEPIGEVAIQLEPFDDSINLSYESNISSDFVSVEIEEDISFNEDNVSFDYPWPIQIENEGVAIPYPQGGGIINIPNAEQLIVIPSSEPIVVGPSISSTITSVPSISSTISPLPPILPTISPIPTAISPTISPISINQVPIDIQVVDTIPGIEASSTINIMTPVSLDFQPTGNKGQDNLVFNNLDGIDITLQSTTNADNVISGNLETIDINVSNLDGYDKLQEIISIAPTASQSPIQLNVNTADSTITNYISYEKWFELQLKRVVLYNVETQTKIIELRERVKKILLDNGMHLSINGIVTDVNGKIVKMSNIKLRPILIGAPSDPYSFVNSPDSGVSYVQLLEVISSVPAKLLGTLVVGTVYLPRNINGQNANAWNKIQNVDSTQGCSTCSQNLPFSPNTGLRYPPTTYGNYDGLPFRRNFGNSRPVSVARGRNIPYDNYGTVVPEPQRVQTAGKSGLGGVLDGLLGNLGVAPSLTFSPTRRLLTGGPKGPKAGPQSYPNDDLPGFRIVGGNAATSSGPPLANKGRSAFDTPSHIV